jgi:pilus assembly protein Flp/PilA
MRKNKDSTARQAPFSLAKWREEDGASAVEYGLLIGLIAVFLITAMTQLGGSVSDQFEKVSCKLAGKTFNETTGTCP